MARILVVYESRYGQTEKIAKFILQRLKVKGHVVDLVNLADSKSDSPEVYEGVILGSGIYGRRFPKKSQKWIQRHSKALKSMPTAFFSVSLAMQNKEDPKVQLEIKTIEKKFLNKVQWSPTVRNSFAGALAYSQYGWLVKQMMRFIALMGKGETDTSRDFEYTNWSDVGKFIDTFCESLPVRMDRGAAIHP